MMDIFHKCPNFLYDQADKVVSTLHALGCHTDMDSEGMAQALRELYSGVSPIDNGGPEICSDDATEILQFSTNDYLGLSRHGDLRQLAAEFIINHGAGTPMGSRLMTGNTDLHFQLEREIAAFKQTEAALVFASGANAMTGTVSALALRNDLVILDQFAHSSLHSGALLSGAKIIRFRHNDMDRLEFILKKADPKKGKLIVVDGVYSMYGDIAPLKQICDLKDKYHTRLLVDDAHGNGVLGINGRGVAELQEVNDRIDIHAGTFSKAFASIGGFVAASKDVVDFLRYTAKTHIFTKALPGVYTALTLKALGKVHNAFALRQKCWDNAEYLQYQLNAMGFDTGNTASPITPVILPGGLSLLIAYDLKKKYRIWLSPIMYPAIPKRESILRIIPTAMHTQSQIDFLCHSLKSVYEKIIGRRQFCDPVPLS